jgi:Asp-tRNA(Asn)/Glu-tRNA(Gln) amidotransferase A subunit family amidase
MVPASSNHCHRQTDDPEKYDGAPASIQILGRRLEEEKLLSLAQVVVDALNDYKPKL